MKPTLTTLPLELRLQIFKHLFTPNYISIDASILHGVLVEQWDIAWEITATSEQIRSEALSVFTVPVTIRLPPDYRHAVLRSWTRYLARHMSEFVRGMVRVVSVEGGVTGCYLSPLELFPSLRVLRLRSSMHLERIRSSVVSDSELPRLAYRDLLLAHADLSTRQSVLTGIARTMFEGLVLRYNERLAPIDNGGDGTGTGTGTSGIRTFFWHTTKFVVDNGATSIRPMIEFVYDSGRDVVRGVHVRRTRVGSTSAGNAGGVPAGGEGGEGGEGGGFGCVICEFSAMKRAEDAKRMEGMDGEGAKEECG